jgi:hypothetical protein
MESGFQKFLAASYEYTFVSIEVLVQTWRLINQPANLQTNYISSRKPYILVSGIIAGLYINVTLGPWLRLIGQQQPEIEISIEIQCLFCYDPGYMAAKGP